MLDFLNCQFDVVRHSRIGRPPNETSAYSSPRPLGLELGSAYNARAKKLRGERYYSRVYISKFMSRNEMKAIIYCANNVISSTEIILVVRRSTSVS
jgi:hypothetical protein